MLFVTAGILLYNSVILSWQPGFDGGFEQFFRIRWQKDNTDGFQFVDVNPHGTRQYEVSDLEMDTLYSFNIMAFNKLGESPFSSDIVQAKTASKYDSYSGEIQMETVYFMKW